ncbi:hypothetical protein BH10BAC6_BH10BAC6_14180 [soil metagenome]
MAFFVEHIEMGSYDWFRTNTFAVSDDTTPVN